MAIKISKTPSKILWSIKSVTQDDALGIHTIVIRAKNPDSTPCSISQIRYYSDDASAWETGTFYDGASNYVNIPLQPRFREFTIKWDSATDYRLIQKWTNRRLEITLCDAINGGGICDSKETYVDVDFTLNELSDKMIQKPKSNSKDFKFKFFTPITIRDTFLNFKIEVDSASTFDSGAGGNPEYSWNSEDNQTDWYFYNRATSQWVAYPDGGFNMDMAHNEQVRFENSTLAGLNNADYYFRIIPLPVPFSATITSPTNGSVIIGNTVTISGTVTNL